MSVGGEVPGTRSSQRCRRRPAENTTETHRRLAMPTKISNASAETPTRHCFPRPFCSGASAAWVGCEVWQVLLQILPRRGPRWVQGPVGFRWDPARPSSDAFIIVFILKPFIKRTGKRWCVSSDPRGSDFGELRVLTQKAPFWVLFGETLKFDQQKKHFSGSQSKIPESFRRAVVTEG